jgi:TnpA family transposase
MKREWTDLEFADWTLLPSEAALLANKTGPTRLGFAVLLKFFQYAARFPHSMREVSATAVAYIARQVGVPAEEFLRYDWEGRAVKYHRAQIRAFLGFREPTVQDAEELAVWLSEHVLPQGHADEHVNAAAYERLRDLGIEPPTPDRLERVLASASSAFEERFCTEIVSRLPPAALGRLEDLLSAATEGGETAEPEHSVLQQLKMDPGRAGLDNVLAEISKLQQFRQLKLPQDLFRDAAPRLLQRYRQRAAVENAYEIRRHPASLRYSLIAAYCWLRAQEITDDLIELLIQIIHRIGASAERRVERELLGTMKRVTSKNTLLCRLAETALANPDGIIREVLFPVIDEQTLADLVKELKSTGPAYRQHVSTVMRTSYSHHYRRVIPALLQALEFRSNNQIHQPVIRALDVIKQTVEHAPRFYDPEEVPLEGIVSSGWRDLIIVPDKQGRLRVDRLKYELCVLQVLRERLRCKEIWVVGANRYRNPDEDLPADFEVRREQYYAALNLPLDVESFLRAVRREMSEALTLLDGSLPKNPHVKILQKGHGWIALSSLDAQPEPVNLSELKSEILKRWPMTSLLDMLKETDLRTDFSKAFKSATGRESLDPATLQKRLLLCLYGLGTNTGLKRVSSGTGAESYSDLVYVRRRFIRKEPFREAIAKVVNAVFRVRLPHIWGEATTACASDSKKFGAWDQNLMTEWHVRYGGKGIMIYWHVERHAVCIYSQLKTCSSSEVAAMIEGLLRHATEMEVDKNYVDSHGQSEVAFAFCRLLGFQLLPRLKAIHAQKLYRAEAGQPEAYPNLQAVLTRPIDWQLIQQQYDQMIKYATALRLGTAETEAILKRFTRNNLKHPTYLAFAELGKAIKTIFLCRYLHSEALRREIQEGLNVIETWNGANSFILYGKGGEIATNDLENQELTMLALHLLQICLVYINTLMIQRVLTEPDWTQRMLQEDLRALTPLIYSHVTPYGTFRLDMNQRLAIEQDAVAA